MTEEHRRIRNESLPLSGIRVVELADWIAAPFASQILGDFGAEVIRVERPAHLDHSRRMGGSEGEDRSGSFVTMARNKESLCLDLETSDGRDLLTEVLSETDVLVTNLRPRTLAACGFSLDEIEGLFPRLVVLVITGFGLTGPLNDRGAVDRVAQAFGGLTYVTGHADGPPTRSGLPVADFMAGWVGALGVVLALFERLQSGRGQVVDLGLYEPVVSMLPNLLVEFVEEGAVRERTGNEVPSVAPGGIFQTSDGTWLQISASSDKLFKSLMEAVDRPELAADARFATVVQRHAARDELMTLLSDWVSARNSVGVLSILARHGVPCASVNTVADLLDDHHVRERGTIVGIEDPDFGTLPAIAPLPFLTRTPGAIRSSGPRHGEHTRAILENLLGLSTTRLDYLQRRRVIGSRYRADEGSTDTVD